MDKSSVARTMQPRQGFDLPGALGKLDRRVGLLQHALVGMEHAAGGLLGDDLVILGELAQEIRDGVVTIRFEMEA